MTRQQISSGSKFEAEMGYSRAIVDGDWIWVSGTTGFNYETMTISEDVAEQADQTFRNISEAMEKAAAPWRAEPLVGGRAVGGSERTGFDPSDTGRKVSSIAKHRGNGVSTHAIARVDHHSQPTTG